NRSEPAGDLSSRSADGTPHGHHRGAIHHGSRETDRRPKAKLVVVECNVIDSDVALFPAGGGKNVDTAGQTGANNSTGEGSCAFHELAPCDHVSVGGLNRR